MVKHIAAKLLGHSFSLSGEITVKLCGNGVAVSLLKLSVNVSKLHSRERKCRNFKLHAVKLLDSIAVSFLNLAQRVGEKLLFHLHNVLAAVDVGELKIEACELGRVLVCIRLLCSEYGTCLKNSLKTCCHSHLLIELRRLSKISVTVKVFYLEYIRAGLGCSSNKLGSVDLNEVTLNEELTKSSGECGLKSEHKMVLLTAEVDPSIVHSYVNIRVILNGESLGIGLDLHSIGIHFLATHLYVLGGNYLALKGDDRMNSESIKHLCEFGVLFLLDSYLKLARDVLDHDESHSSFIAEVFNKALHAVHARDYVLDIGSFHFSLSFILKISFQAI